MSNNGIAKNQHYVPQFLLKNFAFKKGQVNVFDKKTERSFPSNTKNIASENGFYNFTLKDGSEYTWEVALSKLEDKASIIVKQIIEEKSIKSLSEEQRLDLSLFLAIQLVRTRHAREYFKDMTLKIVDTIQTRFGDNHGMFDESEIEDFLSEGALKRYTAESIYEAGEVFMPHFFNKQWAIYEAPKGESFYIGDNPIALYSHLPSRFGTRDTGVAVKGIEIFIPISNKLTIALICPEMLDDTAENIKSLKNRSTIFGNQGQEDLNKALEAEKLLKKVYSGETLLVESQNVRHLNSLQVEYSNRYVFSSTKNFDLALKMVKEDERFRSGPRGKIGLP